MPNIKSRIELEVTLDENNIPENIKWQATDGPAKTPQQTPAFLLSIWDPESEEALRMDLWTGKMQKNQMDKFMFQTLVTLADTYERATSEHEAAAGIRELGMQFGEKINLIKRAPAGSDSQNPAQAPGLPDLPKVGDD